MKKTLIILTALFVGSLLVNASPFSYYKQDKFYFQVTGAFDMLQKADVANFTNPANVQQLDKLEHDNGFGLTAAIGTYYDPVRLEIEYSYRTSNTNPIQTPFATTAFAAGDLTYNSLMLNVLYEAPLGESMFFYGGVGAGASFVNLELPGNVNDTDVVFAYQAMFGVGYKLTREMSLTLGYRFFRTLRSQFDTANGKMNMDPTSINALEMGIKFDF